MGIFSQFNRARIAIAAVGAAALLGLGALGAAGIGPEQLGAAAGNQVAGPTAYAKVAITGRGTVTGPDGFSCSSTGSATCTKAYSIGSTITLTAFADNVAWGGACAGTAKTCSVVVGSSTTNVSATLTWNPKSLTVTKSGALGLVTANTGITSIINCGADCYEDLADHMNHGVYLTASPAWNTEFVRWEGLSNSTNRYTNVVVTGDQAINAVFRYKMEPLTLTISGTPAGKAVQWVQSNPAGLVCRPTSPYATTNTCTGSFILGSNVSLVVQSFAPRFVGWTGACSGTGTTCAITMDQAKSVGANFAALLFG